jgi:hypothetical protein
MTTPHPAISVVLVTGPRIQDAQRVLDALGGQSGADAIEVILVEIFPAAAALSLPSVGGIIRLQADEARSWGHARAVGVRAASAPIVAFLEDHCYPSPGWAEALVRAHRNSWDSVGYAFTCSNPDTWFTRSTFLYEYGAWAAPQSDGPRPALASNNISYKRDFLLGFGDELDRLLEVDFLLHERCRAGGGIALGLAGGAEVAHESFRSATYLLRGVYRYARHLAAFRAQLMGWSGPRRALAGLAALAVLPLLKPYRLGRAVFRRQALRRPFLSALPLLLPASAVSAAGESLGYLFGDPASGAHWTRRQFIPKD